MLYILTAVIIALLVVLAVVYIRTSRLLERLDVMIESAIKGSFSEGEYSENACPDWNRKCTATLSQERLPSGR